MANAPARKRDNSYLAAQTELIAIGDIIPYEQNPRIHSDKQIKLLARLMKKYGVDQPIVVDENKIILKGHGRRLAAIEAGFKEFPIVMHTGLSDEDKRAIRIADNQVSLLAGWDDDLLRNELGHLKMEGFDLELLAFDDAQLNAFFLEQIKGATNAKDEWNGMPEFVQLDKTAFRSVVVHFADQKAVDLFEKKLAIKLPEKQKYIWYPKIKIEKYVDKQYADPKQK